MKSPRDQEEARESTGSWRLCPKVRDGWLLEGRVGWVVATRSEAALEKIASKCLPDGSPAHSFRTLLNELATVVRILSRQQGTMAPAPHRPTPLPIPKSSP